MCCAGWYTDMIQASHYIKEAMEQMEDEDDDEDAEM